MLDCKKAETLLRQAFYAVKEDLNLTVEDIDFFVREETIRSLQADREMMEEPLTALRDALALRFRNYRIIGRIKSLTSIYAKYMQDRSTADAFALKVITQTESQCYQMAEWIEKNFRIMEKDDRIKEPKANGYRDLKLVVEYRGALVEIIIQSQEMYVDSQTLQSHRLAYPWKYKPAIQELPIEYREINI